VPTPTLLRGVRLAEIARAKFPHVYGAAAPFEAAQAALQQLTGNVLVLTPSTLSEILQRLNGLEEALIDHGGAVQSVLFYYKGFLLPDVARTS
jgi:hypothetical protein